MMSAFGMARLGRDAELRYTNQGDAVCNLSLAFSYGRKDETGNRATTWVDATLWGKRAEALAPYLTKGLQLAVVLEEVHMETYEGRNGEGHKLAARVLDVELGSGGREDREEPARPAQRMTQERAYSSAQAPRRPMPAAGRVAPPPRAPAPPAGGPSGFDDMDDDVPF